MGRKFVNGSFAHRSITQHYLSQQRFIKYREKIVEARDTSKAIRPEIDERNGYNLYHKYGGEDARKRNLLKRNELKALAEKAGCKIDPQIPEKDIDRASVYFKKLIEKRAKIKKSV